MIAVVLQTSFMHPPFGFALFYLRGVAPKEVKSSDIYWGALPWVGLQLLLVAIIIVWPGLVTNFISKDGAPDTPMSIEAPATTPESSEGEDGADKATTDGLRSNKDAADDTSDIEKMLKAR